MSLESSISEPGQPPGDDQTGTAAAVLSGKGGIGKSFTIYNFAGEASRAGIVTIVFDLDPEGNLSLKLGAAANTPGIDTVFEAAGVNTDRDDFDLDAAAEALRAVIRPTQWEHVFLVPAGEKLTGIGQVNITDPWLLRDILEEAGIYASYVLVLFDTGGRRGALVTQAMYASDVAYAPVIDNSDSIRKALQAKSRVQRIQKAHALRWLGVIITGIDTRSGINDWLLDEAREKFGDEVIGVVERRATIHEAYELRERVGDRRDAVSRQLAGVFLEILRTHIVPSNQPAEAQPEVTA